MLIDCKRYINSGYILVRFDGKRAYHISASCVIEEGEPLIRCISGYQGALQWTYYKWSGVYELDQSINIKEQK